MADTNIFNSRIELDCFCLDITEAWIKYRLKENKTVSLDDFFDWTEDLVCGLECNFKDAYEEVLDKEYEE